MVQFRRFKLLFPHFGFFSFFSVEPLLDQTLINKEVTHEGYSPALSYSRPNSFNVGENAALFLAGSLPGMFWSRISAEDVTCGKSRAN